ncbi:class I SAM-dependent methyltransferase [Nitrosopumilus piranensis]|uniref:class I SAM-dependent methyltransferase n=1 Tax=Nitrosopumilus piranensis TaxID=1582439 RepID=UPI001EED7A0C|nr:class I SAM-dependent methyltransferase [Nitrosopumilus piranensis]
MVHWTTFGKDILWKNKILEQISSEKSVLDLACGTGILTRQIAAKIPQAKIIGVDITSTYLQVARQKSISNKNISFIDGDAEKLSLDRKFDCITSSYLPKYCSSEILVKICFDHLNDGGKIVLHDFIYPTNKFVQKLWNLYFKVLLMVGIFIPSWNDVFEKLPCLIRSSNWVKECERAMKNYGLKTNVQKLTWGCSSIVTGTKTV